MSVRHPNDHTYKNPHPIHRTAGNRKRLQRRTAEYRRSIRRRERQVREDEYAG